MDISKVKDRDLDLYIKEIEERLCRYFSYDYPLFKKRANGFEYSIIGTSNAINRLVDNEKVDVYSWFDDIWIYVKIFFRKVETLLGNNKPSYTVKPFVSVVFFEGKENDPQKKALFRAEWDSYENQGKVRHPQPHWHFTSDLALQRSFEAIVQSEQTKTFDTFDVSDAKRLAEEDSDIISSLSKFHFSMCSNVGNMDEVNTIEDSKMLGNWLIGLFKHVRTELTYIKK